MARALGEPIFTEADNVATLYDMVRDAVWCHFEGQLPSIITSLRSRGSHHRVRLPQDVSGDDLAKALGSHPLLVGLREDGAPVVDSIISSPTGTSSPNRFRAPSLAS